MAFSFSTACINAGLDAIEATIGASAVLKLRSGAMPANVAAADSGAVLATMALPFDWLAAASGRVKLKAGIWSGTGSDAGTVGHFRIYAADGTTAHMQGTVIAGSEPADGQLALSSMSIASGQPVTISAFTIEGGELGGGALPARSAPTLSLTSNTTYPPPLVIVIPVDGAENDVVRVQTSATVNFASPIIDDYSTLDAAAIAAGKLSSTGVSGISSPTQTYFRASINGGAWSNVVKHGDTVAPTITSSASPSVAENTAANTALASGTLTANEDIATWAIVGGADASKFGLVGAVWTLNEQADHETKPSYVVTFRATDYGDNIADQTMTLTITDIDEVPNAFSFTDITGATVSTLYTSNSITVAGMASGVSVPVTITGGEYRKNGTGSWLTTAGTATNGDTFEVRGTSSAIGATAINVVLSIGVTSDTYTVTTAGSVVIPTYITPPAGQNLSYSASVATFPAVSFPAGLAVVCVASPARKVSGLTIDGVAATLVAICSTDDNAQSSSIWQLVVTAGSKDVVVTAVAGIEKIGIIPLSLAGAVTTPIDTAILAAASNPDPQNTTSSITVNPGGFGVAMIAGGNTATWLFGTEFAEFTVAGFSLSAASFTTSGTPSANGFSYGQPTMVAASWDAS